MKKITFLAMLLIAGFSFIACGSDDSDSGNGDSGEKEETVNPAQPQKSNSMKVFAHYMPWFETPATNNGSWGQHWTMATCNPNKVDANGKREIASHYYPLTGPYASSDAAVLDYQCLLMKYSGIDGVMIDWYGTQNAKDYATNKTNTEAMVKAITKAGMQYAIVYEDATLDGLSDKVAQARLDVAYLAKNFFSSSNYVKVGSKPLLMIFGPQKINTAAEWTKVFSSLTTKPQFIVLNGNSGKVNDGTNNNSQGEFLWVNGNPSYSDAANYDMYIGGAMPGFYDYYKLGGWGNGYTTYDRANGTLFTNQLAAAKNADLSWLQISTWNDYGEGTTIEPTQEYGYSCLTALQTFTGVSYKQTQLELIYRWYKVRVAYPNDNRVAKAYNYLAALMPDKAETLIKELEK